MPCMLRKPHLPVVFARFFLSDFSLVKIFLENVAHLLDKNVSAKNKEEKLPNGSQASGWAHRNRTRVVCAKSQGLT